MSEQKKEDKSAKEMNFNWMYILLFFIFFIFVIGIIARPGVFIIQPNNIFPDGVTIVYHSKDRSIPFFSSPDGICLKLQGSVDANCRMSALVASAKIADRMLIRLPYSHWAYLQSTGGLDFGN